MIQDKPLSDWINALSRTQTPPCASAPFKALKDVTVDQVGDQFFNLQVEVNSAAFMDKDPGVRKSAEAAGALLQFFPSAESRRRMAEEQKPPSRRLRRRSE